MHDYPAVPNVFRVASTHSINNEEARTTTTTAAAASVPATSSASSNKNFKNTNSENKHGNNATATTTTEQSHNKLNSNTTGNVNKQMQNNKSIMQNSYCNKLTTTASIENSNCYDNATTKQQQQHSPYATLPRSLPQNGNGILRQLSQQQRQATNSNAIVATTSANSTSNGNSNVINTISGSIPATGYTNTRSPSIASNLNATPGMNNSTLNLNQMNSLAMQQRQEQLQQQEQQRYLSQQQQQRQLQYTQQSKQIHHQRHHGFTKRSPTSASTFANDQPTRPHNNGYLWIITPVAASISVAIVIAALAGPQWLLTEEKLPNVNYNGTANFNAIDDGAFITKYTKSSLWILCTALQGADAYNCMKIDYFPKEGYQPDPHDSTPAIPYTVTKACPFFMTAGIFLLISFIIFLIPTCSHQNNLYYFTAGIMFIVSGLLMLIGLIAYISILKSEIGSKLRQRSTLQPALFKITYGQSFFLFVFGFVATEFVGVLNIFLYISLQEASYYSRLPCFSISNLHEKIKEGQNPYSSSYKNFNLTPTKDSPSLSKQQHQQPKRYSSALKQSRKPQQIHDISLPLDDIDMETKHLIQKLPGTPATAFACRKHPNGFGSNTMLNKDFERRYYFESAKSSQPKCNLHSKNLAKSLNELYTEPAPAAGPPPPPPSAIKAGMPLRYYQQQQQQQLQRHNQLQQQEQRQSSTHFDDMPHEFPLTRSVSTTTDIYTTSNANTPHMERRSRRNMATNTNGQIMPKLEQKNNQKIIARQQLEQTPMMTTTTARIAAAIKANEAERNDEEGDDDDGGRIARRVGFDDDADDDDVGRQRLCGFKRGIRKTTDELFEEFCKKAGVRPKPRNIYYIPNDDEDREGGRQQADNHEQQQRQRDRRQMRDADAPGYKQLQENDEQLYMVDDQPQLMLHNARRASMFVEPGHLRKLNSNLSLHAPYQKSLYELDRLSVTAQDPEWPQYPSYGYVNRNAFGGSQTLRQNTPHVGWQYNPEVYQSRTLPRSFLRRADESQDSLRSVSMHASATALNQSVYNAAVPGNHFAHYVMPQPQYQQGARHTLPHSNYNSSLNLTRGNKPNELIEGNYVAYMPAIRTQSLQQQPQLLRPPSAQLASGAPVQWPAAIPSSPSHFGVNMQMLTVPSQVMIPSQQHEHPTLSRQNSSQHSGNSAHYKFQRAYAFDEQRRMSNTNATASATNAVEAFDLDEIERERRQSHASLFGNLNNNPTLLNNSNVNRNEHYDLTNGTAV